MENNELKEMFNQLNKKIGDRFESVEKRFDGIDVRLDKIDEGLSNLNTESRNNFKRLEDKIDSLISVTSKISYNTLENEAKIDRLKERMGRS